MTRYTKVNGKYVIHGHKYDILEGSRASVYHGTAYKTAGELTKSNLMQNKNGRIVSKRKHNTAKREKRLVKAGYGTQKGKFGFVKLNGSKSRSRVRGRKNKMHGGKGMNSVNSSPDVLSGNQLQVHDEQLGPVGSQSGGRKRKRHGGNAAIIKGLMDNINSSMGKVIGTVPPPIKLH
jgi:hypothetical protein